MPSSALSFAICSCNVFFSSTRRVICIWMEPTSMLSVLLESSAIPALIVGIGNPLLVRADELVELANALLELLQLYKRKRLRAVGLGLHLLLDGAQACLDDLLISRCLRRCVPRLGLPLEEEIARQRGMVPRHLPSVRSSSAHRCEPRS